MIDEPVKLNPAAPEKSARAASAPAQFSILRILIVMVAGVFVGWIIGIMTGLFTGLIPFVC